MLISENQCSLIIDYMLGLVGKISLSIPVAEISSQPWVINISDVYIVIQPNTDAKVSICCSALYVNIFTNL